MTKEHEWYKSRILWKANKAGLFKYDCMLFEDLENEDREFIEEFISKYEIPIIVFFDSCSRWTIICTQFLCSYHDNVFYSVSKDRLKQNFSYHVKKNSDPIRTSFEARMTNWIKMSETEEYIWFPGSKEITHVLSTIRMLSKLEYKGQTARPVEIKRI